MVELFRRLIAPYMRMVRMTVARGVINLVNDGLQIQELQVTLLADEVRAGVERFQEYGFTSHPIPGAEQVTVSVGGNRDHGIVIAVEDRRYRLKNLAQGEVALYTDEGDKIHLKRDKTIEIVSGNKLVATVENEVEITTKTAKVSASVSCEVTSPAVSVVAATSVQVNSAAIMLGSGGTTRFIVDERFLDIYNNHQHGPDGTPVVKLTAGGVCTSITKAG